MRMMPINDHQRIWVYRVAALLITCVAVHLLAVWAAPRLIMQILMNGPTAQTLDMNNKAAFPPPVTAQSRAVVMPSPDLLYSVCAFDVSQGPVHVKANPLYANNSDNFFVVNDRNAKGQSVDLWLVSKEANVGGAPTPPGSTVVVMPSRTGFLLMRVLTGNYAAEKEVVEAARRTLSCAKV
jgi:uncharacterized membrane protein